MRLWIFCVLAFCAGSSLAQRGFHEYYDETYEEPVSTEDEGESNVNMEHLDNVDKDDGKSKEDLENAESGHEVTVVSDYQFEDNRSSESNDKQNIVEVPTEPMNSPASDIESEDNDDDDDEDEDDLENDGSETDSIVDEPYKLDPPANGIDIEDNDNGYDRNPENYSSEAENVNDNAIEPADFRADSEDIEGEDFEYKENKKSHNSDATEIVEQQIEPMNSPASDIESEDNDDDVEDSENDGSETDSIVDESHKLDPPADDKDIEDNDNGYDGNPENYSSEAENVNENAKEPADFQVDSEDIEEKDTKIGENQKRHNSDASEIFEKQIEPLNSLASDIENKDNDNGAEDSENDGSETDSIDEESNELDPPADGKDNEDEDNGYDGNPENYRSKAEEQQSEPIYSPAYDIESEENDDDEEDSENYGSETNDIVKESNELVDLSANSEENIEDKYSSFEENLENDDSKVNSKEEEPEDPLDSSVDDENREYHDAGLEENQENDGFEDDDIVEVPSIPVKLRIDDEDVEDNTSGYEENVDYNIDNSVDQPKKPVDSSNDGDDLKDKDTDNEENQESYESEAYDNVDELTELGDSLAKDENSEDSDSLVNKVNSKMFEGYNNNDFGTPNKEFHNNTNDLAMDQNRNYDEESAFKPLTDTSVSEETNGNVVNFGKVTTLSSTVSTITEENEDAEPSTTEDSDYVDGILFGSSDIKTIIDDGNENTTDSNMAEKTNHQNFNPILPKQNTSTRVDYYSSEVPPFSSSGMGQNIVPEPSGDTTDSRYDELSDDLSFHHKYAALYSTDSPNSLEYEPSDVTIYSAFKPTYSTAIKFPLITPPVFEALTDDTPHYINSPNFHSTPTSITEYYIKAQCSGIELNITYFSILEDSGAYLLIKPGGVYASDDDAIVFSYQERQERMYRFKDVDRLYMKYYNGDLPSNSFNLSVRMLNGPDPWSYNEQPSLTVTLGGSTPTAFDVDDEKKEDFRRLTTRMAEQYVADGHITWDNDNRELWTNISELTSCTNELGDEPSCVKVTFAIVDRHYPFSSFKLTDLMRMWYTYREEYASSLETMGLKLNWSAEVAAAKQTQHMMVWLMIGAGGLISVVMLLVALWRFGCFKGYSRMPAHDDTESLTKKQSFPAFYSEQRLTWDDDKTTKVDLDGYANIGFAQKLLDMDSDDDFKTTPSDRKTISPSDVYQV